MKSYRNSTQIVSKILQVAQDKDRNGVHITTLMTKANLPHPRLVKFLDNLTGSGLINKIQFDDKFTFVITEKGINYLKEYKKFEDMAQSFGLEL